MLIKSFLGRSEDTVKGIAGKPSSLRLKAFLCSSLLMILLIGSVAVSRAVEIESVIPAYSVAYVSVRNIPEIWDAVKVSPSWQAFLSSEKLKSQMQGIKTGMSRVKELLGVDLRTLAEVFGHRIVLVQIYIGAEGPGLPVMITDVRNSVSASETIRSVEEVLGRGEEYEIQSRAGTYLTVPFGLVRRKGDGFAFRYAFLENLFLFAPGQDTFEAVVDVYLGEEPSLIHDPKFNRTWLRMSEANAEIFAYVNLELLWPMIWGMCDSELKAVLQVLGAQEAMSLAWTANLLTPAREQGIYIYTGDGRELLASLFAQPKSLLSPHLIPASDADVFFAAHLGDPAAVWGKINDAMRSAAGEEEHAQMQSDISRFEQGTGLSLKDDILSSLTGEIGFAMQFPEVIKPVESPKSLLEDGLMLFCGVKDHDRCAMSIERILSVADVQFRQMVYRGVKVYQIHALSNSEVPVGYMFAGDLLIFGNFQKFEALINEEPPLMVSESFAQVVSQLPQQSGLLCYIDLGRIEEILLRINPQTQHEGDMPRMQTLGSIGGTLIYDGEGLEARSIGTPVKSWLETIGNLAYLLFHAPL